MFAEIDLVVMTCLYHEDRIMGHHANTDNILNFCVPKEYRDRHRVSKIAKRLRRLASQGYLLRKRGRFEAFSLTMDGVRVVERWLSSQSVDEINSEEFSEL